MRIEMCVCAAVCDSLWKARDTVILAPLFRVAPVQETLNRKFPSHMPLSTSGGPGSITPCPGTIRIKMLLTPLVCSWASHKPAPVLSICLSEIPIMSATDLPPLVYTQEAPPYDMSNTR